MKTRNYVSLILAFGLLSTASAAWAEVAGRVLVAVGDVSAMRAGKEIPLKFGSEVDSGDALRTGAASNAQIRLTDGGIVALRPQSEFHIDDYHFTGQQDGAEKSFFSLIRGGFRTVTGLIGKIDKSHYMVKTESATIGIRGTNYTLVLCQQNCTNADGSKARDGLFGGVADGKIAVSNQAGSKEIGNDEFFYVASANTLPERLVAPPAFLSDKLEGQARNEKKKGKEDAPATQAALNADGRTSVPEATNFTSTAATAPYVVSENTNATGGSAVLPATTNDTHALVVAYAPQGGSYTIRDVDNATNFGMSGGTLLSYNINGGEWTGQAGSSFADQSGTVVDGSNVYWGRWLDGSVNNTSGYHSSLSGAQLQTGLQYMFGDANTSDAVIAAKSGVVNYAFVDGPRATDAAGNIGTKMAGSLGIDFTARTVTPNINYSVGGSAYNITGFSMAIAGTGFGSIASGNNTGSCTGGGCAGAAIDYVVMNGNFVGATGQGAITGVSTYTIANNTSTAAVGLFKAP